MQGTVRVQPRIITIKRLNYGWSGCISCIIPQWDAHFNQPKHSRYSHVRFKIRYSCRWGCISLKSAVNRTPYSDLDAEVKHIKQWCNRSPPPGPKPVTHCDLDDTHPTTWPYCTWAHDASLTMHELQKWAATSLFNLRIQGTLLSNSTH